MQGLLNRQPVKVKKQACFIDPDYSTALKCVIITHGKVEIMQDVIC